MKVSTKEFLNGKCAAFALAAHEIMGWPIYVGKTKSKNGLGTHIFVYDEENELAFDARGLYDINEADFILYRKISKETLFVLNQLHLHIISPADVKEAKEIVRHLLRNQ